MSKWRMFLDDERFPVGDGWTIVRSVAEALNMIEACGWPNFISFDNDLGHNVPEGRDLAKKLIEMDLDTNKMPTDFDFYVHSQNPVARDAINSILRNYLDFKQGK